MAIEKEETAVEESKAIAAEKPAYDYELGTVTRKRTDTGTVISEREMTSDERQGELFDANDVIESRHEEE